MQMLLYIVITYKSWNTNWNVQNLNDKDLQNEPQFWVNYNCNIVGGRWGIAEAVQYASVLTVGGSWQQYTLSSADIAYQLAFS